MKKLLMSLVLVAAVAAWADYGKDMAATYESCTAVTWQNQNDAALAEATAPEALAAFVKDAASAQALLAELRPAYATCPMKAMQIAAVTQYVMEDADTWYGKVFLFWRQTRVEQRKIWATALLDVAIAANDPYVQIFALDQLRWCGCPCQARNVSTLRASNDKAVAQMAELVANELANR